MIQQCPHCKGSLEVPENFFGQQLQCPLCHQVFIPGGQPQSPMVQPPSAPPQFQQPAPPPPPPVGNYPQQQPMYGNYQGVPSAGSGEVAPMGSRIAAYIIDNLVLVIPNLILQFAVGFILGLLFGSGAKNIVWLVNLIIGFLIVQCYEGFTHCNTVGKKVMKLAVVFDDIPQGMEIPTDRAMKRGAAKWLSAALCGIGLFTAFFNDQKQAWHDKSCKSHVVKIG